MSVKSSKNDAEHVKDLVIFKRITPTVFFMTETYKAIVLYLKR